MTFRSDKPGRKRQLYIRQRYTAVGVYGGDGNIVDKQLLKSKWLGILNLTPLTYLNLAPPAYLAPPGLPAGSEFDVAKFDVLLAILAGSNHFFITAEKSTQCLFHFHSA